MPEDVIDKMGLVWSSIDSLCSDLTEEEWATATECPGWSVQDQISHLVGSESQLMGNPAPEHTPADLSHVKHPMGAQNEVAVDYRRSRSGDEVMAEFRSVTEERLAQLLLMTDEELSADSWTPVGPGQLRDLIAVRVLDAWVHEQDIRRALGRPGHLEGPVVEHSIDRLLQGLPMVVGKKAAAPEGSTVVFRVSSPVKRTQVIGVTGGRARVMSEAVDEPTVTLTMDTETFAVLCNGRVDPEEVLTAGRVEIEGDDDLGRTVVSNMAFMV